MASYTQWPAVPRFKNYLLVGYLYYLSCPPTQKRIYKTYWVTCHVDDRQSTRDGNNFSGSLGYMDCLVAYNNKAATHEIRYSLVNGRY